MRPCRLTTGISCSTSMAMVSPRPTSPTWLRTGVSSPSPRVTACVVLLAVYASALVALTLTEERSEAPDLAPGSQAGGGRTPPGQESPVSASWLRLHELVGSMSTGLTRKE